MVTGSSRDKAGSAGGNRPNRIKVGSEGAAFELLHRALTKEFAGDNVILSLHNWPKLKISLQGEGYDSTITADIAESLVDVQKRLNRAFAMVALKHASAIHLKDEQRDALKFKAKVEPGSSFITVDLSGALQYVAQSMVGKMNGTEILIGVLGLGTIIASTMITKQFLRDKAGNKNVTEETKRAIAMSEQETERHKILAQALSSRAALRHAKVDFDEVRENIVSSIGDADSMKLNGIALDQQSARELARKSRSQSVEVQLNGTYIVSEASFKQEDTTKIALRSVDDGREFSAGFQDESLDKDQLNALRDAAFSKRPVYLSINGLELRGEVTRATILSVAAQPAKRI